MLKISVSVLNWSAKRAISQYKNAAKAKKVVAIQHHGEPLITCKRPEYNLYSGDAITENAQLGEIPLTTDGWHHYKSKGDFFIIHPHLSAVDATQSPEFKQPFEKFQLHPQLLTNMSSRLNMQHTTYMQHEAIPKILAKKHTLIVAETGCGKTIAYLLPIIQNLLKWKHAMGTETIVEFNTPKVLIITQIGQVCEDLCHGLDVKTKVQVGGRTKSIMMNPPIEEIDILVASLGCLTKFITTNVYRMHQVRHVVLDEADTLLDDSFSDKMQYVLKRFPLYKIATKSTNPKDVSTQLVLASATMPTNIEESLQMVIDTSTLQEVVSPYLHKVMPNITQKFIRLRKAHRPIELLSLVKKDVDRKRPVIVLSNKTATSDYISMFLNDHDIEAVSMNKSIIEKIRRQQFTKFQSGQVNVLSTTDLASRGLDTKRACHVINFDFPMYISDYIHRCGRIGRYTSATDCQVTNFISGMHELRLVRKIEHAVRTKGVLPDVNANINRLIFNKLEKEIEREDKEFFKQLKMQSMEKENVDKIF